MVMDEMWHTDPSLALRVYRRDAPRRGHQGPASGARGGRSIGVRAPHSVAEGADAESAQSEILWITRAFLRAANGLRTRDLKLGKLALYQLSYRRAMLQMSC